MKKNIASASIDLARKLETPSFRAIDRQFAKFLMSRCNADELTSLAGAVASALVASGHSCLLLNELSGTAWGENPDNTFLLPAKDEWKNALANSGAVGKPGGEKLPLILDGDRLYMYRYFNYENIVTQRLLRLSAPHPIEIPFGVIELAKILFDERKDLSAYGGHLQAAGAFLPFFSRLSIISGGPGTGKTTVLSKMLALLCKRSVDKHERLPNIRLAAPTGKAAQRMGESLLQAASTISDVKIKDHLSSITPSTLHRLLGMTGFTPTPKHNAENPLEADIVVIDESSMMDITLFTRLVEALPDDVHLIILGDRHQLASVQAGSVMADICDAFSPNSFTKEFSNLVNSVIDGKQNAITHSVKSQILSPLVELQFSYRFEGEKPIGRVSKAVNQGSADMALEVLNSVQSTDEHCVIAAHPGDEAIAKIILDGYAPLFTSKDPSEALDRLGKFMVLTALNEGRFGREGIKQLVYKTYYKDPPVRPIKITENSPQHSLFNGDMGVIMSTRDGDGKTREYAWFPAVTNNAESDQQNVNSPRSFLVGNLPGYVDAFAITIHNSQGSEFDEVIIVLPEKESALLTRELLYTAVTRAKSKVHIYGTEQVLRKSIETKTMRHSGLSDRLRESTKNHKSEK